MPVEVHAGKRVLYRIKAMDFELPPDDDPRRIEIRKWLAEHPNPSGRQLAEAGYVAPHWPKPWGLDADPIHQLIIEEELKKAGVRKPTNPIGIGWAGPTILEAGTQEQKERYLFPILSGEEIWCQLFSEPGAGSDLASLQTKAVRDGDEFIVNGQKIWTSLAHIAKFGILLARTDPNAPKHKGITYFICPMDAEGITIRPIKEMTGSQTFNEVFLDNVRIPAANVVGEVNDGWRLAKVTLANERVSLSEEGAIWGSGPTALDLIELVKKNRDKLDAVMRQRLVKLYTEHRILQLLRLRTVTSAIRGEAPGPWASVRKLLADEHGQHVFETAKDLSGAAGMLADRGPFGSDGWIWHYGFLFSPALTIGGGTWAIQRNIIGERILGLPKEPNID
jgi:alkylation response protein AidB-like acyl-CoA dehydrogenase